jgi:hypothetical protein
MPISTIPVKWLQGPSNHHTSRFEVTGMERGVTKPERNLLHESLAERKLSPSSSAWQSEGFVIPRSIIRKEGADTLGRAFKSRLGLLISLFTELSNLALPG